MKRAILFSLLFQFTVTCFCNSHVNITFQVNMKYQAVSPNGVFLMGDFNSWYSTTPLSSDGDIYSATIQLTPGATVEYKFVNGNDWETILGLCAVGDYGNRTFMVPDKDSIVGPTCFNYCLNCSNPPTEPSSIKTSVTPLIKNNWQTFTWPYNAYLPLKQDGINGHVGNECGFTAIARIIHYWHHVPHGIDSVSADYFDSHFSCVLDSLNLDYSNMPYELSPNAAESTYEDVAKLMQATSAIGAKIQIGLGQINSIGQALAKYFYFKECAHVVNRTDFTKEEWINIFKTELSAGRPILIGGRTTDSPAPGEPGTVSGHYFICDGYNENNEFYYNYSFGQIKAYADIDEMGDYSAYHNAIIGLEPRMFETNETITICEGGSYNEWTESGEYTKSYPSSMNSDSVVITNLLVASLPEKPIITRTEDVLKSSTADNYQWYFNDNPIDEAFADTLLVTEVGEYYVNATNTDGCSSQSAIFLVEQLVTNVALQQNNTLKIFPNPVKNTLQIYNQQTKHLTVDIYNIQGNLMQQKAINTVQATIDFSSYPPGIYLVNVISDEKSFKYKVTKE